jgi:hypothetical protein
VSNRSLNGYVKQENRIPAWVWFEGATALKEGQGVCYNWDYGTATAKDGRRYNRVELPTILNARYFAGVAARDYTAKSGGQFIEINIPGSVCNILCATTSSIGVGVLTCEAGGTYAGYFRYAGFQGEGSAVPLQTVVGTTSAPLVCLAKLQEGVPSGLVEVVTAAVIGGAITCMVGGVSYLTTVGAAEFTTAHATFTMADGTISGLRKKFYCLVECGATYDFIVTVNGIQVDGSTALQTLILDDVADEDTLEWTGDWYEKGRVGTTVS